MAMKRFLLFLVINLPIFGVAQSWSGDLDKFESSGDYWMLDGAKTTETLSLKQAYTLPAGVENWEWEFGLYFRTKPTSSNRITVYPVEGTDIYFQAGKNGYEDLFQFSVNGKEEAFTFSFTEYEYKETEMSVRITLTDGDQWHIALVLQDRLNGRSERQSGDIEALIDLPEEAIFHYKVKHTKSKPKHLGVSPEISMTEDVPSDPGEEPEEPDSSSVTCQYIEPLSASEIRYKFTDEVDKSDATFSISGKGFDGKTEAVREIYDDTDHSMIKVRFPQDMILDEAYTFYWEKVKDSRGLPLKDGSLHGLFAFEEEEGTPDPEEPEEENPEPPAASFSAGDIRINEVMANPNGFIPNTEYVELYNTLDKPVQLTGWSLQYGDNKPFALDEASIQANDYLVLYRSGDEDFDLPSDKACALDKFTAQLANTGKSFTLYYKEEKIDHQTYPEAEAGISWEYGPDGGHLCSDESGGTPGRANSDGIREEEPDEEEPDEEVPDEKPGQDNPEEDEPEKPEEDELDKPDYPAPEAQEIIINELLPEPFVGGSEYIELLNRSDRELSLEDVCISTRKKDGSLNTRYPLSAYEEPLQPGDYLLISKSIADVEAFYSLPAKANCLECKLPALSNTGASVVLYRASDEEIIDEVTYSPKWHNESVKNRKGISLERIDPDGDSQDADNWTSAASSCGSGTPGGQNSQWHNGPEEDVTGNEQISVPVYQPSGNYLITYRLSEAGYSARGWIFDMNGRRVAVLVDNESLGTNGVLEWDGIGRDGSRLSPGIYIMYLELWNTSGTVHRKKSAFLVH